MRHYDTLKEAKANCRKGEETYRKVCGGWLVMTWFEYYIWKKQK